MKAANKRGRKPRPFVAANGEHINGMRRRPHDGRWILADGRTFTEPDEKKAIERFRRMTDPWREARAKYGEISFHGSPVDEMCKGFAVIDETRMWRWIANQIRQRPAWVAEKTGIEQIGYLKEIKPPAALPSFAHLEKTWVEFAKCSEAQQKKVLRSWRDFVATTQVSGLRDITPAVAIRYQDDVHQRIVQRKGRPAGPISGKQQQHLFCGIRRLLTFNKKRAADPSVKDTIAKVLAYLSDLTPSQSSVSHDPKPIEAEEWKRLYATAEGDDRAMILLMLNGAFYLGEVIDLRWSDIKNGCIVTHREKTGKCVRVCSLWRETSAAIDQLERKGEYLFYSYQGKALGIDGAQLRFSRLAERAGVKVTGSQMRDGAYTAAVEANVNEQICKLLGGHRCGMADHYVKRNPQMVAPATDAVYRKYFGKSPEQASGQSIRLSA